MYSLIATASSTSPLIINCGFGLFASHSCSYGFFGHPILFSLGDGVAALSLIIAVLQLSKPSWKTILAIRGRGYWIVFWSLIVFGLASVITSAVSWQIPFEILYPPINPASFEFLAFIFFSVAALGLYVFAEKQTGLFTMRRAERFYKEIARSVARSNPDSVELAVDLIAANLNGLLEALKNYSWLLGKGGAVSMKKEEQYAGYANAVMNVLLSEKKIVDFIVQADSIFVIHLIQQIHKKGLGENDIGRAVEKIFERLFDNPQSFLYAQLDYSGLALFTEAYKELFGNASFNLQFHPFRGSFLKLKSQPTKDALDVFTRALEVACIAHWEGGFSFEDNNTFAQAFYAIEDASRTLVCQEAGMTQESRAAMTQIIHFFDHSFYYSFLKALETGRVSQDERNCAHIDSGAETLTYLYVEKMYDLFHLLSVWDDKNNNDLYFWIINLIQPLIGVATDDTSENQKMRKVLLGLIWKEIDNEMKNLRGVRVLKTYCRIMLPQPHIKGWRAKERNRLIDFLATEVVPLVQRGEILKDKNRTRLADALVFDQFMYQPSMSGFSWSEGGKSEPLEKSVES